jgi:hypothetical protein
MIRWARIEMNGTTFELAGIHLVRPVYPALQQQDTAALIALVRGRTLPLVMAGDFNMSPWTEKLQHFERSSGLRRYNTCHPTWPMERGKLPLLPLVPIDHVFDLPRLASWHGRGSAPTTGRSWSTWRCNRLAPNRIARDRAPESLSRQEDHPMSLRPMLALLAALVWTSPALAATENAVEAWKSATCKCCINWVKYLEANGLAVTVNAADPSMLERIKRQSGIGEKLASCHTAKIGPYVIEGHVPAPDIKRLVAEQPDALGLTVPGMPVGSPGMEQGAETEPYDVLLINKDGTTEPFASH